MLGCVEVTGRRQRLLATFVERSDDTFAGWFASFERDLDAASAPNCRRLELLQGKLSELAGQLDSNHAHKDQWMRG